EATGFFCVASLVSVRTGTSGSLITGDFLGLSSGLMSPRFGASGGNSISFMISRMRSFDDFAGETGGTGTAGAGGSATGADFTGGTDLGCSMGLSGSTGLGCSMGLGRLMGLDCSIGFVCCIGLGGCTSFLIG